MNLSNTRATVGLSTKATPLSTLVQGGVQIGANNESYTVNANVAYSLQAFFSASGNTLTLNHLTGATSSTPAFVVGTAQVETATAVGTVATSGTGTKTVTVVVTAAGMTNTPKSFSVAVAANDTATLWAAKVRVVLSADSDVSSFFAVSGTAALIVLTRKPATVVSAGITHPLHYANVDFNISLAAGANTTGITAAPTSVNSPTGVATSGVLVYDGDAKDFEGYALPTIATVTGEIFKTVGAAFVVDGNVDDMLTIGANGAAQFIPGLAETTYIFTPNAPGALQITVTGITA